jgi:C-terminal processing protease CtpA/Prc
MYTKRFWLVLGLIAALAAPAVAGGKCKYDTQTCLDMMVEHYKSRGFVGVMYYQDEETGAITVKEVIEGTPAEASGFKAGDQLVAINGLVFGETDEETMHAAWKKFVPGTTVTYTVRRDGKNQDIDVTLAKFPEEHIALDVGMHMLDHVSTASAQK